MNIDPVNDFEADTGVGRDALALAINELEQARFSGRDVAAAEAAFATIDRSDTGALERFYQSLLELPAPAGLEEASDLPGILSTLPATEPTTLPADLADRVRGAWHGRVVGNMFGKPVEVEWPRAELRAYLEKTDSYPMRDYIRIDDPSTAVEQGFAIFQWLPDAGLSRGRVAGGVRDDDIDYTILGLHLLETYGVEYSTRDVAREWMTRIPAFQTYTAERVAYQNVARWVSLDEVGSHENPYREWIGALIRADIFGYVHAGNPRAAATLAHADAFLSHRSNGIYGAMWAAALVATAFTAESPEESIARSLDHIPARSLLGIEIRTVLEAYRSGASWDAALTAIEARYAGMHWVHTLNNSGALAAAILWGEGDFASTVGLAAQAGLDADSIGATAGSWAGAFVGFDALPAHLVDPLGNTVDSAIFGYARCEIDDLANRTLRLTQSIR